MQEMSLTDKIIKTLSKIVLICFAIFVIGVIVFAIYFTASISPVSSSSKRVEFVVEKGKGNNQIIDDLYKNNIIKNAFVLKLYLKFNDGINFQAGTYTLDKNMTALEIVENLNNGTSALVDSISITFVEGKRYTSYIKKISDAYEFDYDETLEYLKSDEYLDKLINKYWFITEDIKNKNIYYPLEGYIFPDTYEFMKSATIDEIMDKIFNTMDQKLSAYKSEIELSNFKIHGLLTMASMVELEAVTPEDRAGVASVFYNRINSGMTLGSDVTTYYAEQKEMTDKLYLSELNKCNAYNTRGTCVTSLPVGPICSPSYSSIVASIEPSDTTYLFFVADKNNKVYFSNTAAEQDKVIRDLKKQNLWPE